MVEIRNAWKSRRVCSSCEKRVPVAMIDVARRPLFWVCLRCGETRLDGAFGDLLAQPNEERLRCAGELVEGFRAADRPRLRSAISERVLEEGYRRQSGGD